mmetsp:Transcript_43329/g.94144  ORF Transcript_43329/g.94144 Transcript_43329/m.94144 type:complete len:447 (+) Transcript_43329:817-2157(+)
MQERCGQRVKAVAINQQRDQLAEALEGISLKGLNLTGREVQAFQIFELAEDVVGNCREGIGAQIQNQHCDRQVVHQGLQLGIREAHALAGDHRGIVRSRVALAFVFWATGSATHVRPGSKGVKDDLSDVVAHAKGGQLIVSANVHRVQCERVIAVESCLSCHTLTQRSMESFAGHRVALLENRAGHRNVGAAVKTVSAIGVIPADRTAGGIAGRHEIVAVLCASPRPTGLCCTWVTWCRCTLAAEVWEPDSPFTIRVFMSCQSMMLMMLCITLRRCTHLHHGHVLAVSPEILRVVSAMAQSPRTTGRVGYHLQSILLRPLWCQCHTLTHIRLDQRSRVWCLVAPITKGDVDARIQLLGLEDHWTHCATAFITGSPLLVGQSGRIPIEIAPTHRIGTIHGVIVPIHRQNLQTSARFSKEILVELHDSPVEDIHHLQLGVAMKEILGQ